MQYTVQNLEAYMLYDIYERILAEGEECATCVQGVAVTDFEPYGDQRVPRVTYECNLNAPIHYCPGVRKVINVVKEYARIHHL